MMPEFVLTTVPGSPFARAAAAALIEKNADWGVNRLGPRELRGEAYMARQPFARMPLLTHGDFELYETQAILRYIDRVLPEPALTPADPRRAARMDQMINMIDWHLFQGVGNVIGFQRIVAPMFGSEPDLAKIADCMPRATRVVGIIAAFLGTQTYITGDSLTLADLHLYAHLDFLIPTPEWAKLGSAHANLAEWITRMADRPSISGSTIPAMLARASAQAAA